MTGVSRQAGKACGRRLDGLFDLLGGALRRIARSPRRSKGRNTACTCCVADSFQPPPTPYLSFFGRSPLIGSGSARPSGNSRNSPLVVFQILSRRGRLTLGRVMSSLARSRSLRRRRSAVGNYGSERRRHRDVGGANVRSPRRFICLVSAPAFGQPRIVAVAETSSDRTHP